MSSDAPTGFIGIENRTGSRLPDEALEGGTGVLRPPPKRVHQSPEGAAQPPEGGLQVADLAEGQPQPMLQIGRQGDHIRPDVDARCAFGRGDLVGMPTFYPALTGRALATLGDITGPLRADRRKVLDKVGVPLDLLDGSSAVGTLHQGDPHHLLNVVWATPGSAWMSLLAAWLFRLGVWLAS